MKKLSLIALVVGIALIAGVAVANVPAPPVNQILGFDDKVYNDLVLADCQGCHFGPQGDRHHMLYGSAMPAGICSATDDPAPRNCYTDADCVTATLICSNSGDPCLVDADCPRQYQHPVCTTEPYCAGTSAASNVPGSQNNGGVYGCLTCHEEDNDGGVINFLVEDDCTVCHIQLPNSTSVHHLDEPQVLAKAGKCVYCHGDIVDDMGDGHSIPTYTPSLVTPEPVTTWMVCDDTGYGPAVACSDPVVDCPTGAAASCVPDKAETAEAGACNFCHDAGTDLGPPYVDVVDNHDTHHGTGVYKDRYGNTVDPLNDTTYGDTACDWCHYQGNPHNPGGYDAVSIRTCEGCHGMESLHNIQVDTNGGGVVAGGEDFGYGHIGEDTPGADSDCWGCHGFSMSADGAVMGSGVPAIYSVDPIIIAADTDTAIAVTGTAFSNGALAVRLTADDGSAVTIDAADVTDGSLTATATLAAGTYGLQVVKDGEASSVIKVTVVPDVAIADIMCSKCLGTMTITGVNFAEKPAGTDEDISVTEDGRPLNVINWSDTEITVSGARCKGDVVVEGVFGSSQ